MSPALLPLQTRVVHFNDAKSGHGLGTIVAYNGIEPNAYLQERQSEAIAMASLAGLASGLAVGFYDKVRCPYVVQWDNGYKDVYEPSSLTVYDPHNPKHAPGLLVEIRLHRMRMSEDRLKFVAKIDPSLKKLPGHFYRVASIVVNIDDITVEPAGDDRPDDLPEWPHIYAVKVNGFVFAYTNHSFKEEPTHG